MGVCGAISPSSVQAYGIAGDTHIVHVLNNRVVSSHRITVRALLQPGPAALVLDAVVLACIDIDAKSVSLELVLSDELY